MAQAQRVVDIRSRIHTNVANKVTLMALGNSNRTPEDLAKDLIHASDKSYLDIAVGCCLCEQTIQRLANDETQWPRADTINRILRFFNFKAEFVSEKIKPKYANKPKQ